MKRTLICVVGVVVLIENPVFACECGQLPDIAQARASADLVVEAEAIDAKRETTHLAANTPPWEFKRVTLRIARTWKGDVGRTLEIRTGTSTCDYDFGVGQEYLIFAKKDRGEWRIGQCSGTAALKEENVQQLGQPLATYPRTIWDRIADFFRRLF